MKVKGIGIFLLSMSLYAHAMESSELWKGTKTGRYSLALEKLFDKWSVDRSRLHFDSKISEVKLSAIPSPDDGTYVGIEAVTSISASLDQTIKVLSDIKNYKAIYPDLELIEEIQSQNIDHVIHWKFGGPLGTHTVYDTVQRIRQIGKDKAALIYRLSKSEEVLDADGVIFLEEHEGITKYLSIDFFNAKWGIAGTLFKNKIWSTACENTGKATVNIRGAAESSKKITGHDSEKVLVNCGAMENRKTQEGFEKLSANIFD